MWTPFGSTLNHGPIRESHPDTTHGSACQRNGLQYRWVFDGTTGNFYCIAVIDRVRVR